MLEGKFESASLMKRVSFTAIIYQKEREELAFTEISLRRSFSFGA